MTRPDLLQPCASSQGGAGFVCSPFDPERHQVWPSIPRPLPQTRHADAGRTIQEEVRGLRDTFEEPSAVDSVPSARLQPLQNIQRCLLDKPCPTAQEVTGDFPVQGEVDACP